MTSAWRPSLESWGLPRYFFQTNSATEADVGPVAFGRVYGVEEVAVEQALHRVVAQDVHAALAVPGRPLSALLGKGVRAADTQHATPAKPVTLGLPVLTIACIASGVQEPVLEESQCQFLHPHSMLMAGCDAVLETMSHHFKGDRVSEKVQCKIISPVPEGTNVIPTGADLAPGAILVQEGRRITSADLAALCMAGVRELPVYVRPRVAVCVLHKYFQTPIALDAPGANALPDAVSPLVLGLLAQWGVQVDTVRHLNLDNQPYTCATNREVNAVSSEHDLTIVVGFLGSKVEADEIRARARLPLLAEPSIGPVEESYTRHRGMIRPADITHVARANAYWDENAPQDRCNVVMSLRGLPLPVLTAMYTQVRPVLDALSGVGAYPVQVREFGFASPGAPDGFNTRRREILGRPAQGQSGRQGVRWLTGVLAASAPRDRERHWLQLARIERGPLGETMLRVLPSEEHQVSGMIGAEAMVGIEKGEGELPAGSIVEYFLLD